MHKAKRFTIKDVAREANVSVSTVSHALNDTRYVKAETKTRIQAIARQLDYNASKLAAGLRKKSLRMIAVFVANIESQFFAKVLKGINRVALSHDFHTMVVNTFYNQAEEEKIIENLKNQLIDGAIFVSGFDNRHCIKRLHDQGFPFVLVARKLDKDYPSVLIDNFAATRSAVGYLSDGGHRKIGYLTMDFKGKKTLTERFAGYRQGLKDCGLSFDPNRVVIGAPDMIDEMEKSYLLCSKHFRARSWPSALIAATDHLAAGAYAACKEMGLKIPEHLSVVGFDNLPLAKFLDPPLTSIKQPKEEMGAYAMEMLMKRLSGEKIEKKWMMMDTKFIERKSVGPAHASMPAGPD